MGTRFKLQQFNGFFRLYDSETEEPADGEIARYDVNMEEAENIENGAMMRIENGDVVVFFPEEGDDV